jgi:hypothetical protein
VDVRCDCERLRHDLKNPSTTLDAESSQHSALLFDQRPRSARAGRKCAAKNRTSYHINHPPLRIYPQIRDVLRVQAGIPIGDTLASLLLEVGPSKK